MFSSSHVIVPPTSGTHLVKVRLVALCKNGFLFSLNTQAFVTEGIPEPNESCKLDHSHFNAKSAPVLSGIGNDVRSSKIRVGGEDVRCAGRGIYHLDTAFESNVSVELLFVAGHRGARATAVAHS